MSREITVLLKKQPEPETTKAFSVQILSFANEFIKSPLFIFVFGASLGTAYPTVKDWLTPSAQLALRQAQEQARADAALIAPFISNLDATKPGQFEAARAALLALEESASAADNGKKRPVYSAVNKAIEAVGVQLRPPTNKGQLSADVNKQIESTAQPATLPVTPTSPMLNLLAKDTLVYIQVDRSDQKSLSYAENTANALRDASVLAPGIEKLATTTMPKRTQIRYFHDDDKPKAEQLAALVARVTGGEVLLAKPKLEAKLGTLEVWFGTSAKQ